jgi:hypothetical protein
MIEAERQRHAQPQNAGRDFDRFTRRWGDRKGMDEFNL